MIFGPAWAFLLAPSIASIEVNAEGGAQPWKREAVVYERPVRAHPELMASPEYQAFLRSEFPRRDEFREMIEADHKRAWEEFQILNMH